MHVYGYIRYEGFRVQVPNSWVLRTRELIFVVQVLGKQMIMEYLGPSSYTCKRVCIYIYNYPLQENMRLSYLSWVRRSHAAD